MRDLAESPTGRWYDVRQDHVGVRADLEDALFRAKLWRDSAVTPHEEGRAMAVIHMIEATIKGIEISGGQPNG